MSFGARKTVKPNKRYSEVLAGSHFMIDDDSYMGNITTSRDQFKISFKKNGAEIEGFPQWEMTFKSAFLVLSNQCVKAFKEGGKK